MTLRPLRKISLAAIAVAQHHYNRGRFKMFPKTIFSARLQPPASSAAPPQLRVQRGSKHGTAYTVAYARGGASGGLGCPNGCVIVHITGEAILSADNSGKPLGGRCYSPKPLGAHCAPQHPLAGGRGLLPVPRTPPPLSVLGLDFSVLRSWPPTKNSGHALVYTYYVCNGVSEIYST